MIGFSVQVKVFPADEAAEPYTATALVSLDTDADVPVLDLRLAGDDLIINADVSDAYRAVSAVDTQFSTWKREQEGES